MSSNLLLQLFWKGRRDKKGPVAMMGQIPRSLPPKCGSTPLCLYFYTYICYRGLLLKSLRRVGGKMMEKMKNCAAQCFMGCSSIRLYGRFRFSSPGEALLFGPLEASGGGKSNRNKPWLGVLESKTLLHEHFISWIS